jgi:3-deoxy-D-manno-octulosonic acid kinase
VPGTSSAADPIPHAPVRGRAGRALAHPSIAEQVAALLEAGTLYAFAALHPEREPLGGRGEAWRIPAPGGAGAGFWAVRHYVRGGTVAGPLLGDLYARFGTPRPTAELLASEGARARGVRTPRVLAAATYPAGIFRRGDLVTEWLAGATTLAAALYGPEGGTPAVAVARSGAGLLADAGALVRELTLAGVEHADLNARNILLREESGRPELWVLDLDRARLHPEPIASAGIRMLARLERSLARIAGAADAAFDEAQRATLRRGAGDLNDVIGRDVPAAAP